MGLRADIKAREHQGKRASPTRYPQAFRRSQTMRLALPSSTLSLGSLLEEKSEFAGDLGAVPFRFVSLNFNVPSHSVV